ncbi:hypothetical protein E1293_14160 [Actinomadura darangshiensis]|uniref:Uncharacterized protein n=1 Tax=Actinomadura darangshiensis TaxID=705336 RepID=A0A4R5BFM0_9ACTN|nr:hypothetical protein [Actinomadura darangshiensis]TDD83690.1 hypothetical protein E1293_14160 [Actinomadura darangshiensis]
MAESLHRSGGADFTSGDDRDAAQAVANGGAPEPAAVPFGGARPWWSSDSGDGTGPHGMVNGTGPQVLPQPRDGSGPYQVVAGGTGPIPVAHGSGAHPIVGTGPHRAVPGGSGAHPVVPNGTGPIPAMPGAPAVRRRRPPRLLLIAGGAVVAAVVLMAGALAFRTDGGPAAKKDARTTAVPASGKVIEAGAAAGGLHRDRLTSPQASEAYPFIAGAVEAGGVPVAEHGMAVYSEEPVRRVNVLFAGGTGRIGNAADFLQKAQPSTFIAGQDADPGGAGGKSVCGTFAVLAETHTYCAWATEDSYGIVASNRPTVNPQFPLMADVMRRIRKDVEKPK